MHAARFAPYQAKNIRHSHRAHTPGMRADIYRNGALVARVSIPDNDSAVEHQFVGEAERYTYDRDLAVLEPDFFEEALADVDTLRAWFLVQLLKATHLDNQLRVLCQSGTVFRLRGDVERAWRVAGELHSEAPAARIRAHFGDAVEVIANEELAPAPWDGSDAGVNG
jgi:hypothetical protein